MINGSEIPMRETEMKRFSSSYRIPYNYR